MIECSKCGATYTTERLFCGKCREQLGIRCPVCGFVSSLDDRFCGICLTELEAHKGAPVVRESDEADSMPDSIHSEILIGVQEDEAFGSANEVISQEEIEGIFHKDGES